mgnify:CR=1 FL=1
MRWGYLQSIVILTVVIQAARAEEKLIDPTKRMTPERLVRRAVMARGAKKLLSQFKGVEDHVEGVYHLRGQKIQIGGKSFRQSSCSRTEMILKVAGQEITGLVIYNNGQAWMKRNGQITELPEQQVQAMREEMALSKITGLNVLLKKTKNQPSMRWLGESKFEDRVVYGVEVQRKGKKKVSLYIDKKTFHLVRIVSSVFDTTRSKEMSQEVILKDYTRHSTGLVYPKTTIMKRGGQPFMTTKVVKKVLHKKLDDALFAKPK